MTPEKANWNGLTHVIHFSANPVQTSPYLDVLVSATDSMKMENNGTDVGQVNRLITNAHAHGVKVLLSLGGVYGTGATNMNFVCSDSVRTDIFATASVAYAKRRGYDGVEVDWESPSSATVSARLYRILRRELNKWPVRGLLAIAAANNDNYNPFTKYYDTQELINDVDQVNLMMYDMHFTPSYSGSAYDVTAYNAPLYPPGSTYPTIDQYSWNYDPGKGHTATAGPRYWNSLGMPYSKMGAGIPFYGYIYKGKTAPNQPRAGVYPQYISYPMIMFALSHGGTYHWDDSSKVPWISGTATAAISWYAAAGDQFYITFDNPASVTEKVKWAKKLGFGGMMIYELYMGWNDTATVKDPLLRALVTAMGVASSSDSISPTVTLTAPANGDSVTAGTAVTISANASDNVGVARVDFLVNGSVVSSGLSAPYSFSWNTTGLTGTQSLAARAYDAAGNSKLSSSVTVYMKAGVVTVPAAPALASPATGATGQSLTPTLSWNASTGAATYRLQVSANSSFTGTPVYDDSTLTGLSKQLPALAYATTYYWHVSAKNSAGKSVYSLPWNFIIQTALPPPAAGDLWIYQEGLTSPWANYSWNSTNTFNSTEHAYAGSASLKSVAMAWGGIGLHNGPWGAKGINPALYSNLEFAVYNISSGLTLKITLSNEQNGVFPQTNIQANVPVNQWIVVSVPMSKLNPNNLPINQVTIQNYTSITGTFFIDNLRLVGSSSVPGVPIGLVPANGATGQSVSPIISWGAVTGATSYRLQVSTGSGFTGLLLDDSSLTATSRQVTSLAYNTLYYWRVSAKNSSGTGIFSAIWTFTTVAATVQLPATPIMTSPVNGATGVSVSPIISWGAVTGATSYRLQVSTGSGFTGLLLDDSSLTTTSRQVTSLAYNTLYYWRVSAKNSSGKSAFSTAWSFTTRPLLNSDLWIYQEGLTSPWANYSWNSTNTFNSTEHAYAGSASLKSVAMAWGGIGLHNGPWGAKGINPALYSNLEFAVYNISSGLTLKITLSNEQSGVFPQTNIQANVPVNQWIVVSVPMSKLDPNNLPINQVSIQNYTGITGTFFIDNLRLVGVTVVPMDSAVRPGLQPVVATEYALAQNFPNPFNPTTSIRFTLPVDSRVDITVYNSIGQEIRMLISGEVRGAGTWSAEFDGSGLPSGMYICRLKAVSVTDETVTFSQVRKMLLMK